ncbi:MAG: GAF domain-containing protein [Candidatus Dormibacteraeota bacterium]|nr:GAF domain-containing protein [Candidatus Dormibacteraeota bacterium]
MDATASGRWPRFTATVSERQVAALSEVSRTLVSDADYQQVLAALIEKVGRILDVESGGFMLFDEPSGELQLQLPAFGFNSDELIRAYRVPLSAGGNAVTVFLTGQPYFTNDAPHEGRVLQRFVELYHAQRILSVPLQVEGRSIGVFHAINKRSGDFAVEDVELLQLIAPQLAVIIKSANMLRTLRDQEAQLERLIHIHNNLTEVAIGGHDLVDLVDRLAELIQAEVVVAESGGQLVAAPRRSRATSPELVSLIDDLIGGHGDFSPRQIELGAAEAVGVPIIAVGEVLGVVIAVAARGSLGSAAIRTLQQAALVLALSMVKGREVAEVELRLRADILEHLLVAETSGEEAALLHRLGLEPRAPLRLAKVVLADVSRQRYSDRFQAGQARLHHLLGQLLERTWPGAVPITRSDSIVLILPEGRVAVGEQHRRLEQVLDAAGAATRGGIRPTLIAVGSPARSAEELRRSLEETDLVVMASRLVGDRRVVFVEDLGLLRLLAQPAGAADIGRFVSETLGPLDGGPDSGGSRDWIPFLEALVASNFSVKQAARRAGVHLNTARYRATRIEEKLGIDFDDAEARLNLMVALRLRQVGAELRGSA